MIPTKNKAHAFVGMADSMAQIGIINLHEFPNELSEVPSENSQEIIRGLCTNCDFLGKCVWQHNNKLSCEHFK